MSDFCSDFEFLMHKGYYVYVESDGDDRDIILEARDPKDDSHIIKASYDCDGERLSYTETSFIKQMRKLINK